MSLKILMVAAGALAASSAFVLPALSATPDGQNQPAPQDHMRRVPLRATILFNLIDRNGDGMIDQDEISALQKAIFSALDTNHDGKLSLDEFRKITGDFEGGGPRGPDQFGRGQFERGPGPGFFRHSPGDYRQGEFEDGQRPAPQDQMMPQLDDQDGQPPQGAPQ